MGCRGRRRRHIRNAEDLFVIQIYSSTAGLLCERVVIPEKRIVGTDVPFFNEELGTVAPLSIYRYDVDALRVCCSIEIHEAPHFISIHSYSESEDCYFGWLSTSNGDGTIFGLDAEQGITPFDVEDNLSFCLTGETFEEGEGEPVEGEPVEGEPGECDDDDPCTRDYRDPITGECIFEPVCNDNDPCTLIIVIRSRYAPIFRLVMTVISAR